MEELSKSLHSFCIGVTDDMMIHNLKFALLDFETTGLANTARAIEVGICLFHFDQDFNIMIDEENKLNQLINPGANTKIPISSTFIHHITDEMVSGMPFFGDDRVYGKIKEKLQDRVLVGHKVSFDFSVLSRESKRSGKVIPSFSMQLCTLFLSRRVFPFLPTYKLAALAEAFNIKFDGSAHRAYADCVVNAKLLGIIFKEAKALGVHRVRHLKMLLKTSPKMCRNYDLRRILAKEEEDWKDRMIR